MAPIKFEENIKEKLGKRKIQPSENAWNKLSERLDVQEESSRNPVVWWLGLAASLVGIFLVTTLFIKTGEDKSILPTLVETPIKDTLELQDIVPEPEAIVEHDNKSNEEDMNLNNNSNNIISNQILIKKTVKKEGFKTKSEVVTYNILKDESIDKKEIINSNSKSNNAHDQEIVAQIPELDKEEELITDSEIESLLERAQNDLVKNNIKTGNTLSVDANSLLLDVETDLEQSFRDKMFNTLISGYNTLKTAVAERND